jgi:hypothetical protein
MTWSWRIYDFSVYVLVNRVWHQLGDKRLEIIESADVVLHVAWYWAASVSTQLVLNKYNTNYEALRLADSTALAFSLGKFY